MSWLHVYPFKGDGFVNITSMAAIVIRRAKKIGQQAELSPFKLLPARAFES